MRLYPYQERVLSAIQSGRNVILQTPTGTGKTLAALVPYFQNLDRYAERDYPADAPLSLTCRYAVPMRVLASQFEREYRNHFSNLDNSRGTDLTRRYVKQLGLSLPAIQTGENPDDPKFESPLTFCTIDQLLASFIGTPYSLGPGQANLNVGAVVGSYLVLDEFHLYPLDKGNGARLTTLAMLRLLKGCCRFVLMTATFSSHLLDELACLLDAEVVTVEGEEELEDIMKGRSRTLRLADAPMTPEAILAAHDAARARNAGASLVVCNTVARAQDVYLRLKEALQQRGALGQTRIELLHSRFTPEHRQEKSKRLEGWLGKDAWRDGHYVGNDTVNDTIIVATQVVEVGLNISAGVLHTELAPANSLIQRAGRCARFDLQSGEVIVYPIPPRDDSKVSYKPYDDDLCEATWAHLGKMTSWCGAPFGFREEQALIDAVHTDEDQRMLEHFSHTEKGLKDTVLETLATHDRGKQSLLIREVADVSVVIHPNPEDAITVKPFTWQGFQLHPTSLVGALPQLERRQTATGNPWLMKQLILAGEREGDPEEDSRREPIYSWDPIRGHSSQARDAVRKQIRDALRIALPPELAAYDKELGFRLLTGEGDASTGWISAPPKEEDTEGKRKNRGFAKREQRSYVEHITGLRRAYDASVRQELAWLSRRLEVELCLPVGGVDLAMRLAIALHDLGKLSLEWQRWAHAWQRLLTAENAHRYAVAPHRQFLAKTDMLDDWERERRLKQDLPSRRPPPHACIGVEGARNLIAQRLLEAYQTGDLTEEQRSGGAALLMATLSAIARHHTPQATTYTAVSWSPNVQDVVAEALRTCRLPDDITSLDLVDRPHGEVGSEWLTHPPRDGATATWLAFAIVRALRLCDQRAEREW